ncbi:hypothetical protein MAUB1S_00633 [Mycolicibacterium aubagnense]
MLDNTDGLPGPVIEEQVREAGGGEAEVGRRPLCPFVFQRESVSPGDVDGRHRAGDGVEARGEHQRVETEGLTHGLDAGFADSDQRLGPQVDQAHMGLVERRVVAGVEAQAFRTDRIVIGAQ